MDETQQQKQAKAAVQQRLQRRRQAGLPTSVCTSKFLFIILKYKKVQLLNFDRSPVTLSRITNSPFLADLNVIGELIEVVFSRSYVSTR